MTGIATARPMPSRIISGSFFQPRSTRFAAAFNGDFSILAIHLEDPGCAATRSTRYSWPGSTASAAAFSPRAHSIAAAATTSRSASAPGAVWK